MELFSLNFSTIDSLLIRIKSDINKFRELGMDESRINISMPNFTKNFLEHYLLKNQLSKLMDPVDYFFGCNIVSGYNNQICVFDNMATPNHFTVEPITIDFENIDQKK